MLSSYARWLRYAAYTLLITGVVVGGYYFVYVQERAEQLAEDRLALLEESAQYVGDEIGRVQVNIENTLRDPTKLTSAATLDSALRQISGVTHAAAEGWTEPRCLRTARRFDPPSDAEPRLSATLTPAVRHPHLTFRLRDEDGGGGVPAGPGESRFAVDSASSGPRVGLRGPPPHEGRRHGAPQ